MPEFHCSVCDAPFSVPQKALDKYPGWKPRFCRQHSPKKSAQGPQGERGRKVPRARTATVEQLLPLAEVRRRFSSGPQSGVFTDGSCMPNPGPGGWGVVWVEAGEVVAERHGQERDTTNNRMELTALIEAYQLLPAGAAVDVHTDSQLCVNTITRWAAAWERNGWRRKGGEVKNLDLVKPLWALAKAHPKVRVLWIAAHNGQLWNEYADALATAWARDEL